VGTASSSQPPPQLEVLDAGLPGGVIAGFTTRFGGVSAGAWAEANLALHVADEARHALANRDLLARALGSGWVHFPQQVHGAGVGVVDAARAGRRRITRGGARGLDALVTALPGVPIGVLVADCVPVLIADVAAGVVAAAHAGRRGLAAGVLAATVAEMVRQGGDPDRMVAAVGPAICGRCYEVPADTRAEVAAVVPGSATTTSAGTPGLDLPAGAAALLAGLGIAEVRASGLCTREDDRFFSYRRDGRTGRFAGVVMLCVDD
jgi:hypothetical protein